MICLQFDIPLQLVTQPVFTSWMELARQIADRPVPTVCIHGLVWGYTSRLQNDLYCVEWDVKLYYTIPWDTLSQIHKHSHKHWGYTEYSICINFGVKLWAEQSPLILLIHLFLDCTSFWDKPKLSMSLLTQSHQDFFGYPLCHFLQLPTLYNVWVRSSNWLVPILRVLWVLQFLAFTQLNPHIIVWRYTLPKMFWSQTQSWTLGLYRIFTLY